LASDKRSAAFFNSDVATAAEDACWRLGQDYGLDEDQTAALAGRVETAIHDYFEEVAA
jgi:hypothetical protein